MVSEIIYQYYLTLPNSYRYFLFSLNKHNRQDLLIENLFQYSMENDSKVS